MIDIKNTFVKLTSRRYPHGTEDLAMEIVKEILPNIKFEQDEFGNYYYLLPKSNGEYSDSMFTSHLDTINSGPYSYISKTIWDSKQQKMVPNPVYEEKPDDMSIKHVFDDDFIKTDGNTNLGADDKAGTTILMNMISENVPGLYYFFVGEESGCIGSSALSKVWDKADFPIINRCISFDRRGYDSIITSQGGVTSSNEFATELANRLNEYGFWYKPDPTGIYTDSAEFTYVIPECTNISVGYFSEHTKSERQDIEFLTYLAVVCAKGIEWDTLPTVKERDKAYSGKKSYGTGYGSRYGSGYNSGYNSGYRSSQTPYYGYGEYGSWYDEGEWYENHSFTDYKKQEKDQLPFGDKDDKTDKNKKENKFVKPDIDEMDFDSWYEQQRRKNWDKDESLVY